MWSIVNVHVYSVEKILIVLNFYFAPSINLNNIIRQEKCIMCNRHIQIKSYFIVNKQKDWTQVITTLVSPPPKHVQLTLRYNEKT